MSKARQIVEANASAIQLFVEQYMLDNGVGVQMVEVVAKELFGQQVVVNGTMPDDVAKTPKELVGVAIADVVNVGLFGAMSYDLETVIAGAASLEFLLRYARKVNPAVIPPGVIPSDEVVTACLELFHDLKSVAVSS